MIDGIADKLRKVLALTTSPVEAEALAASEMLAKLLAQYNLEIADLEERGADKPGVTEGGHDLGKAAFKWKLRLADEIADHYYCVSLTDHYSKQVKFAGRPDNVKALTSLYAWVVDQTCRLASIDRKAHVESTGEHIDPLRWQIHYGEGLVSRLGRRLAERRERYASTAGTALVIHHAAEVSDYLEDRYGYRRDGQETHTQKERRLRRQEEERKMAELKRDDIEAYYTIRPWERPLTPEQQREKEIADAREAKKWNKKWERRMNRPGQEKSGKELRTIHETRTAQEAGAAGASRVNLEPFIEGGKVDRKALN